MATCPNCRTANADSAKFCSNCGTALEAPRSIEGERKFATVLFADVAHSTTIAEQLDPEDWALVMNGAFVFMNMAVARYGGTVSRLMGDAVLALFGAPVAHEDDAERAVRAGLDIQAAARDYARDVAAKHGVTFELRVGINTGTAVLAFVGDAVRTEYTAMGDTANVAARLQSSADPGTVLISAETYRLVQAVFDVRPRGHIEMKGRLASVDCYEVVGPKAVAGTGRGVEGLSSPLVGRDREIALLRDKLAGLDDGLGAVVAVVGEAGLGKSRLIAELRKLRDAGPERPGWFEGRAVSYGQAIPYYPWRQLGRQMIGATEADTPAQLRERLAAYASRLGVPAAGVPFLETMLAIESDESKIALGSLGGDAVIGGVAEAVVHAFKGALHPPEGVRPLVIVVEDLHWSDTATLELLAQVAALAAFEPLLMICVMRPDRQAASWALLDRLQASLGAAFDRIDLDPLPAEASRQLLGNLLQIEDLPDSIRSQILDRSEGNPFYLEEVLRTLIDGGQVVRDGDHWRATRDIIDARIPDTLAGVLSARIDRLPENTKRVAQTAAVIGRVFQHKVLETVCRDAPQAERIEHIEPHIAQLSYEQVVRERARNPEREYIFKHALTCDAAYDLLLKGRRRELHLRTGTALEALYPERRDELAAMLAWHFAEADDPRRAVGYARRAAENSRRIYARREEMMHRELIVKELERIPEATPAALIDAILTWVEVRHRLSLFDGVIEPLERAVSLARESGDKERLGLALSWIGNHYFVSGFPSRAVPYLTESQALSREVGRVQPLLLPLFYGTWALVDSDPATAVDRLQEVIDLAREHNIDDIEGHATAYRGMAYARLGDYAAAQRQIDEALALVPKTHAPVKKADIHIAVGMAYQDMGEVEKGLEHARIGAKLAEEARGIECACAGYFTVGRAKLSQRLPGEAKSSFAVSKTFADAAGFEMFLNIIRGGVAVADLEEGQRSAIDDLRAAVANAKTGGDAYSAAVMAEQLGDELARLGEGIEAIAAYAEAEAYFRSTGMRPYLARVLRSRGTLNESRGENRDAASAREEAARLDAEIASLRAAQHPMEVS